MKERAMRYQISGKQIDIGEALQTHVKAELGEVVEKYAQRPTDALWSFPASRMNMSAKPRSICLPA
jgi:ribosome-associated translation inhibitor RaiA